MVQPLDASSELRPDLARAFDRIEFYYAGWQAVIPILRGAQPHTLELRAVLSDGREFTLRQINLQ
jgi:hypothetical protein